MNFYSKYQPFHSWKCIWNRVRKMLAMLFSGLILLTHWGRMVHICVGNLTIIGSDNGLLPDQCQANIRINGGILWIEPLGTNSVKFQSKFMHFHSRKCIWKCCLQNDVYFISVSTFSLSLAQLGLGSVGCQWAILQGCERLLKLETWQLM